MWSDWNIECSGLCFVPADWLYTVVRVSPAADCGRLWGGFVASSSDWTSLRWPDMASALIRHEHYFNTADHIPRDSRYYYDNRLLYVTIVIVFRSIGARLTGIV